MLVFGTLTATETAAGPGGWDFLDPTATWSCALLKKSYSDGYNTTC